MKKLFLILVFSMFFFEKMKAEEYYVRCVPKVMEARGGNLKTGSLLNNRILFVKFEDRLDLTKSEKPKKTLIIQRLYIVDDKEKKVKKKQSTFRNTYYFENAKTTSFNFEDSYLSKTLKSYDSVNINFDGESWVGSGNNELKTADENKLESDINFNWFAKCLEIDEAQFNKPSTNEDFTKKFDLDSW